MTTSATPTLAPGLAVWILAHKRRNWVPGVIDKIVENGEFGTMIRVRDVRSDAIRIVLSVANLRARGVPGRPEIRP